MFRKFVMGSICLGLIFGFGLLVLEVNHNESTFLERVANAARARRPVEANQRKARQVLFQIADTAGTNNATEAIGGTEIVLVDAATGTYNITLNEPFYRTPMVFCVDATSASAPNGQCTPASVTTSSFTIYCADGDSLGTLINPGTINCLVNGWDAAEW